MSHVAYFAPRRRNASPARGLPSLRYLCRWALADLFAMKAPESWRTNTPQKVPQ